MKGCARARRWLVQAADGELVLDERLRLDRHLARCAACRAERDALDALEEAMLGLPEPPPVEARDLERAVAGVRARIARGDAPAADPLPGAGGSPEAGGLGVGRALRGRDRRGTRARRAALAVAGLAAAALVVWIGLRASGERGAAPRDGVRRIADGDRVEPRASGAAGADASAAGTRPGSIADAGGAEAVDAARLAAARAAVADELARAFAGVPRLGASAEIEAAVRAFERATSELDRDWPVVRLVQGHVGHADAAVAGAAVRLLGARGDLLSASALRDALERPELAAAAVVALGELGEDGLAGLAVALRRPELATLARDHVAAIGGARAAATLADAARRRDATADERAALLAALAAVEPCPAGAILDLAREGALAADAAYRALGTAPGGGAALVALADRGRRDPAELLAALAAVRPPAALPWIAAQATERDVREAALDCLAAYADADALARLLELHASGRVRAPLALASAGRLLAAAPDAAVDLARRADAGDPEEAALAARALRDLLVDVATPAAAPGLVALAFGSALGAPDRPWAVLAAGEVGHRGDLPAIAAGVATLGAGEELLAAAALLAASALGDPDAILLALDERVPVTPRRADAVLSLCADADDRGARAVTLFKVARELRPLFDDMTLVSGNP